MHRRALKELPALVFDLKKQVEELERRIVQAAFSNSDGSPVITACADIARAVASGVLENDALLMAERKYGMTEEIRKAWKARSQQKAALEKLERLHVVRAMSKAQCPDAEIAAVLSVSSDTIRRLRKEAMRPPSPS